MKQLSCRFEMLISEEQNEEWTALAKSQNLTKAELVRRTMESYLQGKTTQKDWKIYQQLGKFSEELAQKKVECVANPTETINELIQSIEQLRLEVIFNNQQLKRVENRESSRS